MLLLTACAGLPPPTPALGYQPVPPVLPPALDGSIDEAAPALILAERTASISGDLALLAELWTPDGRVVDARATENPHDDYIWAGREAVLDRYLLAVFPSPPPALNEVGGLKIISSGDEVIVENGNDRWQFVREEGRWWMRELIYSRPTN